MKALVLGALVLVLVTVAFCIPATGKNGKFTQHPTRSRGVKTSGESERTALGNELQNSGPGSEPGGDSTNQNANDSGRRGRKSEEKNRPRGRKRTEGTTASTTPATTITTSTAIPQIAESSKTPEPDFVFDNYKTIQEVDDAESINATTKSVSEESKNTKAGIAVTTDKMDSMEGKNKNKAPISKKQSSDKNAAKSSGLHEYHQSRPYLDYYQEVPPEYLMPQMEEFPYEPQSTSWNIYGHNFYPSSPMGGSPHWSPLQDQLYETLYNPMWPEEEQFYDMGPYWWDNMVQINKESCCSKKNKKKTTTTTVATVSTTTTAPTTTSSSVATELVATSLPTTTTTAAAAIMDTTATTISNTNSTWKRIEGLLRG
ncbi:unnamed protein product [Hydatigera taeniaeformis]|uniref:Secreted mucin n=1 Tax=Hydatigena taeniaeformis TaxID=6205 RepID=A0A0R3X395_HYDTA|nr:unnamed protein product [Hydatigera taeniaeformis]